MDCTCKDSSALKNVKLGLDLKDPSPIREQCSCNASREDAVDELMNAFGESLHVRDVKSESACDLPFTGHGDSILEEENGTGKFGMLLNESATENSFKCFCKSATFPVTGCRSPASADGKGKAPTSQLLENTSYSRSVSLPSPQKLVSALKGTREKEGAAPRKLTVSWAPDVYDPSPSSISHLPKKKSQQQYKRNKKHGKGKQKGKNSKGSSGAKDKKHCSKRLEPPPPLPPLHQPCLDSSVGPEKPILLSNYKSAVGLLDFDTQVDSPDSNCGSSLLRKARSTLHLPCAEAT